MLRVVLANVNRSSLSHDLVSKLVVEQQVDLLIITEPNIYEVVRTGWIVDTDGDVAIKDVSGRIAWNLTTTAKGIVAVETEAVLTVGAYVSPNCDLGEFTKFIDTLHGIVANAHKRIMLLGNFNSKFVVTGCMYTNRRGEILSDLMGSIGCHCINDGTPTYKVRGHTAVLDLTILDNRWMNDQWDWQLLPYNVASDHLATILSLKDCDFSTGYRSIPLRPLAVQIENIVNRTAARLSSINNVTPEALTNVIKQEIGREEHRDRNRGPVYWWTSEIAIKRQLLQS
ncbi:uncharacterized protein LOC142320057 [Lycorma delicatula]|uniref:uncharacterized protein LOC142320057 n=1 Tax=Lycorma delicatula TaxID=130591 RepID=UPI003F5136FF